MKPLIVALDVDTEKEALALVKATKKSVDLFKIGPSLILKYGPSIIKKIRNQNRKIFLDLKFHDIPNTMMRSIKEAGQQSIYSATVHACAGKEALRTVSKLKRRPKVWGVTVLTSMGPTDLKEVNVKLSPKSQVKSLAQLTKKSGLDGIVASVHETKTLRSLLGRKFDIVTPGIRMPGNKVGDQKRIATPKKAAQAGSTYMVVGRPILESKTPDTLADEMLNDWRSGL